MFFLENNFYAVSTHVREQTRETSRRSATRLLHQSGPLLGSQFGCRDEEEDAWRARAPLLTTPARLEALGVLDDAGLAVLDARARAAVDAAAAALTETPPGANAPQLRAGVLPDPAHVDRGMRGGLSELAGERFIEAARLPAEATHEQKYIDAVAAVLLRNMERDPRIVLIGEDVHRLRGGVPGSSRGVMERFPERVFATPICESGFTGMALGGAVCGLRPVAEVIDLRSLDPGGLDWAAIEGSVKRTSRVLIAEQTARGTSHGARIAQETQGRRGLPAARRRRPGVHRLHVRLGAGHPRPPPPRRGGGGPAPVLVELAELVVELVPHADWCLFAKNGTDATTSCVGSGSV